MTLPRRALLAAVTLLLWGPTHAFADAVIVTDTHHGGTVQIARDQELHVRLRAQSGTGFSWALINDSAPLRLTATRNERAPNSRLGAAETQIFVLRATGSGGGAIEFAYRRPWETGVAPARLFKLRVVVLRENAR
jgi:inhibitor of cysteine peptidase